MKLTDEMLSAAAPEAAERWLNTLPGREDCGHDFSLTFEAAMLPVLNRRRRHWRALIPLAAVVAVLAGLLAFGAAADRPDDYRVYAAQEEGFVSYVIRPKDDGAATALYQLTPAWVPEDLVLSYVNSKDNYVLTSYKLPSAPRERWVSLEQHHSGEDHGILSTNCHLEDTQVNGEEAIYIYSSEEPFQYLLWTQGADGFFVTAKNLEREEIFRFAESLEW